MKRKGIPVFDPSDPESVKRYRHFLETGELAEDQEMMTDFRDLISFEEYELRMRLSREGLKKEWVH